MASAASAAAAPQAPALVSRPSLAYFGACTAGLALGAARTYYDLLDVGVPFRALGDICAAAAAGGAAGAPHCAAAATAAAAVTAPAALKLLPQQVAQLLFAPPSVLLGALSDARLIMSRLLQSELGLFVALNWLVSVYCIGAVLTTRFFLGVLSPREASRLTERLVKYVVFKAVFIGAVLVPSLFEVSLWMGWFLMVGHMKLFIGACKDRLEALLAAPTSSARGRLRPFALVLLLLAGNAGAAALLALAAGRLGWRRVLLFAFDAAGVSAEGWKVAMRYVLHIMDQFALATEAAALSLRFSSLCNSPSGAAGGEAGGADEFGGGEDGSGAFDGAGAAGGDGAPVPAPSKSGRRTAWLAAARAAAADSWQSWEGRGGFTYHAELAADLAVNSLALGQYAYLWLISGGGLSALSLLLLVDVRCAVVALHRRLRAHLRYRAATHNVNFAFPDVAPEELVDADCAICREHMSAAKHLPCGHTFHLPCLRAWLQQSGSDNFTCPVCRTPLFIVADKQPPARGGLLAGWLGGAAAAGALPGGAGNAAAAAAAVAAAAAAAPARDHDEDAALAAALQREELAAAAAEGIPAGHERVAAAMAAHMTGEGPGGAAAADVLDGAALDAASSTEVGWLAAMGDAINDAAMRLALGRLGGGHRARSARRHAFESQVAAVVDAAGATAAAGDAGAAAGGAGGWHEGAAAAAVAAPQQRRADRTVREQQRLYDRWQRRLEQEREDLADEIETGWGIVGIADDGEFDSLLAGGGGGGGASSSAGATGGSGGGGLPGRPTSPAAATPAGTLGAAGGAAPISSEQQQVAAAGGGGGSGGGGDGSSNPPGPSSPQYEAAAALQPPAAAGAGAGGGSEARVLALGPEPEAGPPCTASAAAAHRPGSSWAASGDLPDAVASHQGSSRDQADRPGPSTGASQHTQHGETGGEAAGSGSGSGAPSAPPPPQHQHGGHHRGGLLVVGRLLRRRASGEGPRRARRAAETGHRQPPRASHHGELLMSGGGGGGGGDAVPLRDGGSEEGVGDVPQPGTPVKSDAI